MKQLILLIFFVFIAKEGISQNANHFWIGMSPTFQNTKETRFTSTFRDGIGFSGLIGYANVNDKRAHNLEIEFTSSKQGKENISYTRNLIPSINYQLLFLRKRQFAIGPELEIGSLIQFRNGLRPSTNRISYLIWNSLGISINKSFYISRPKLKFPLAIFTSMPILSYVIRPSYSYAFTDRFLEQENFNFALDDLRSNIIRGGKIRTFNTMVNLKIAAQAYHFFNRNNFGISVRYQMNYLAYLQKKSLFQFTHQVFFVIHLQSSK